MVNWGRSGVSKVSRREKVLELASEIMMAEVRIDSVNGFRVW